VASADSAPDAADRCQASRIAIGDGSAEQMFGEK
jgi:hypothetical protein